MNKIKTVIAADDVPFHHGDIIDYVYGSNRDKIAELTDLHPVRITTKNLKRELPRLAEIEAIRAAASSPLFVVFRISLFINILIFVFGAKLQIKFEINECFCYNLLFLLHFCHTNVISTLTG